MRLEDVGSLYNIGNTIQIAGAIYTGEGKTFLCYFPGERKDLQKVELEMSLEDWLKFLRQTDLLEVEVWTTASDGKLAKAIFRKCQRQIDAKVQWAVFKRDHYRCRYCSTEEGPFTVDHLVCWEEGGPTTPDNLVTACKNCNKTRGNTPYAEWLLSSDYLDRAAKLSQADRVKNEGLLNLINHIPRNQHTRNR